jgi:hypothetical protein
MIQPGTQDPAKVAAMTGPELLAEARRLAGNLNMTGMEHTAAVLRRLCDLMETQRRRTSLQRSLRFSASPPRSQPPM